MNDTKFYLLDTVSTPHGEGKVTAFNDKSEVKVHVHNLKTFIWFKKSELSKV